MSGSDGSYDLLRRATQAMMSNRQGTTEDEGADQIGSDTPRSGVATPQPDLQDKRLPGIMSYFGQVRSKSLSFFQNTSSSSAQARESENARPASPREEKEAASSPKPLPTPEEQNSTSESATPLLPHERSSPPKESQNDPYPTPPCSQTPSERGLKLSDASGDGADLARRTSLSQAFKHGQNMQDVQQSRRASVASPLTNVVTATSAVGQLSAPESTSPTTTATSQTPSEAPGSYFPASVDRLKKLTLDGTEKSGPPTPTRALSSTQTSQTDAKSSSRQNSDNAESTASGTLTPISAQTGGAKAPNFKGKLTIKVPEARNLRRSRDPYVVAVFQRSELISSGPRSFADEDELSVPPPGAGGIPIQRQGSDRGMAIPMRSRQSSNTSLGDYGSYRNRPKRTFTCPQWDAEAVFDVVEKDMLVDISVYDHGPNGEELLGHVDIQAHHNQGQDETVKGWYPLRGNVDTIAEHAPTGEIYVEIIYHGVEKRHYGPDDFQILRLIGKGTFGQVYQVRKKDTGRIYAMKVLSKKVIVQKKEVAHTVGERNILVRTATSESPFIVGLKFSFQTTQDLFLVTDYMSGGELFWHLQKEGRFDEKRAKFYIAELILAIQHLHFNDIVYRDLKPENILLDANGHIALCDFGLSKANLTKNDTTNTFCGTTEYLAPEVLLDEAGYTKMVDFWSLGVLVFEMCCGWSPFYAEDTQQMYKNIAFGKVRFPRDTLSQEGRNFVKGLLNRNPKHRLGALDDAEELKRHPFFGDVDWDALSKKLITPPFKPKLLSDTDVSYFDPEFTNALNQNGSLNERAQQLATGFTTSTPLSPTVQANFQGFTFVDESSLDDHMADRYDDEEMRDARRDNDWDELDDIDLRKANRMSGIVRTGANEEAFGNSQFDM